jgi:hypothetical protein
VIFAALVFSPNFFTPRRVLHCSSRCGFTHGPASASHGFGVLNIAPNCTLPLSYAEATFILLYVVSGSVIVSLGENQPSATVSRHDAFLVHEGNWFGAGLTRMRPLQRLFS